MFSNFKNYILTNSIRDNLIFIPLLLMPFALCMSIFVSEILVIIVNISFIILLFNEKDIIVKISRIKYQIFLPFILFIIILLSLISSDFFSKSFAASFFYFRYIILALATYYLIYKNQDCVKYLLNSIIILSILIFFNSIYELLQINNIFGLKLEDYRINSGQTYFITSFFDDEKKLGSFLIRLLPFIISITIFLNYKKKYFFLFIILFGFLIFLSSERVAFFLFLVFFILCIRIIPNKIHFISFIFLLISSLTVLQPEVAKKYVITTLFQLGITENSMSSDWSKLKINKLDNIRYFSEEHENLIKSGIEIFKRNPLVGSGVKTFYDSCNKIKREEFLNLTCSTHPHNTYIQLLSDTGIISFILVSTIFVSLCYKNIKIFFMRKINNYLASFYILNIGIILNLMPLIPSGSIYNNWINLMIYLPMGFWLFLYSKIKDQSDKN